MQDRDRPGWCGVNLAKHRAHARRSQAAFYVPPSELRKLLPGNYFLPSGQLLRVRQDALRLCVERTEFSHGTRLATRSPPTGPNSSPRSADRSRAVGLGTW